VRNIQIPALSETIYTAHTNPEEMARNAQKQMNPVSRFLTDETRNQNNDTMSNSEVRKMSSDKIKKIVNKILIICKNNKK